MYHNKVILVTGGTGSWGNELIKHLLTYAPKEVRVFSRGEKAQVEMNVRFSDSRIRFIVGDIRDYESMEEATVGVDYVFHLAALKHVTICEYQPGEAIKTNILGTQNVIKASIKNDVKKVIYVSTDKAVEALNLYGMTKGVGERLMINGNTLPNNTSFICIRAGNVLGSNGSVVPLFKEQIRKNHKVTITDKDMTRYFITIKDAINLLFKAVSLSVGGEIFVVRMQSYYITDIAKALIEASGIEDVIIEEVGIRPGEKMNEVLVSEHEAKETYKINEDYYVIVPSCTGRETRVHYENMQLSPVEFVKYTSADEVLGQEEAKAILKKGHFI